MDNTASLYIVATPIGNLDDFSPRAQKVLATVSLIAAEDTRHSAKLCQAFNITAPMLSLHDYNEASRIKQIVNRLQAGESVALISDAGTPLISDPGYQLVRHVRGQGIPVVPIPGPCALITALCAAGMATDRFCFEGFLPAKNGEKHQRLTALAAEPRTMIFYESTHRLLDTLKAMQQVFGEAQQIVLAKELTKRYETIHAASLVDLQSWLQEEPARQRGEFVLILAGVKQIIDDIPHEAKQALQVLLAYLPLKQAARACADITGVKKNRLYEYGLTLNS